MSMFIRIVALLMACGAIMTLSRPALADDSTQHDTSPLQLVAGVDGTPEVSPPATVMQMGGVDYFVSDEIGTDSDRQPPHLWRTDGTITGTYPLTLPVDGPARVELAHAFDNKLFFTTFLGQETTYTHTLWSLDAPSQTITSLFATTGAIYPRFAFSNTFYFGHYTGENPEPETLWQTDGTQPGTMPVPWDAAQVALLQPILHVYERTPQALYLRSTPMPDNQPENALEILWRLDESGLHQAYSVKRYENNKAYGIRGAAQIDEILYFFARVPGTEDALWRSDGTAAGTVPILPIQFEDLWAAPDGTTIPGIDSHTLVALDEQLIFFEKRRNTLYVHRYDPLTRQHTAWPLNPRPTDWQYLDHPQEYILTHRPIRGQVYFSLWRVTGPERVHAGEVWRTDGTPQGTNLVAALPYGAPTDAVATEQGVWILMNGYETIYLALLPFDHARAVLHHSLGMYHILYPQLQLGSAVYVTKRPDPSSHTSYLWRVDPEWTPPPPAFLPVVPAP